MRQKKAKMNRKGKRKERRKKNSERKRREGQKRKKEEKKMKTIKMVFRKVYPISISLSHTAIILTALLKCKYRKGISESPCP